VFHHECALSEKLANRCRVSPKLEPAGQPFHRRAHHAARPPRRKPSPANRCPTFGGYGIDYITAMPSPDETNDLLREIRDLLAGQESRYEIHRAPAISAGRGQIK
jgi:hypothetical protein